LNEENMTPGQIFENLTQAADYLNGMKNLLTSGGWSEENAQLIIIHFLMGGTG